MSPARSLSSALQGGFHLRILQSTCCNEQCPASHQCCTPWLLCFNNDHLHVSSEYKAPRYFCICHPRSGKLTVYLKRRGFSDPNLTLFPRASIQQSAPEKPFQHGRSSQLFFSLPSLQAGGLGRVFSPSQPFDRVTDPRVSPTDVHSPRPSRNRHL